jgi:hypothetical protein
MVVLDELEIYPRFPVPVSVVGLQEKAPLVGMREGLDAEESGQRSFTDSDQACLPSIVRILTDILRYTLRI